MDKHTVEPNSKVYIQKQVSENYFCILTLTHIRFQCICLLSIFPPSPNVVEHVFLDGATNNGTVPSEFNGTNGDEAKNSEREIADEAIVWVCKDRNGI